MMTLARNDITSQLQPRHSHRRQRQPGARERNSSLRRRLSPNVTQSVSPRTMTSPMRNTYCMSSAAEFIKRPEVDKANKSHHVISAMKDLSTIEAIRESMKSTEKRQPVSDTKMIPNWMLDLDMNLDVSSVDVIPPFEPTSTSDDVTFNEQPTVTFIYNEDEDVDLYGEYSNLFTKEVDSKSEQKSSSPKPETTYRMETTRTMSPIMSSPISFRASSASPSGRKSRGSNYSQSSPRRYQGDKKVMSMQQGGIRSTPMQPTSKKFINQMLTFTHVKVHDKKVKKAKPAIDTKMPSTFKIALDRKKLVEERSFNRSFQSSTPVRRPSIKSSTSKQSKEEKTR